VPILYRHIRLDTNKPFYIGIGRNIRRAYTVSGRSAEWKSIYESTDIEIEILFVHDDWKVICEKEKEFIAIHGRQDLNEGSLVNKTSGGSTGTPNRLVTNEEKMKISNALKGRFCGNKNPFYGKTHTEESKKKFSRKGSTHSIETKLSMSQLRTGSRNSFYGKTHRDESLAKMKYYHNNRPNETLIKMSESQTKLRWVKRGTDCKRIHMNELNSYVSDGWERGRLRLNTKHTGEQ
jgi:hypothetical protein